MSETNTRTCPACFKDIDLRATRCPHCTSRQPDAPPLHRDVPGRIAGGVCAALAEHLGWDATLLRVLFVVSLAVTGGTAIWIYALLWVLTPFEAHGRTPAARFGDWVSALFTAKNEIPPSPPA